MTVKVTTEVTHEQKAGFGWDRGPWEWEVWGCGDGGAIGTWGHILVPSR